MREKRIRAYVSSATRRLVKDQADARGVPMSVLVEEALHYHLRALRELPADVIIPPRIVVSRETGERLIERIRKPRRPHD